MGQVAGAGGGGGGSHLRASPGLEETAGRGLRRLCCWGAELPRAADSRTVPPKLTRLQAPRGSIFPTSASDVGLPEALACCWLC